MKKLYGVQIEPIDFGWGLNKTVDEILVELKESGKDEYVDVKMDYGVFWKLWEEVKIFAYNSLGWEVDFREKPEVIFVPTLIDGINIDFKPIFIFKQDNNGISFVVSPINIGFLFPDDKIEESR